MFQFPRSASSPPMDSVKSDCALPQPGSPIRTSPDQCLLTAPRGIFVVRHVLLRLLAPRHPPCALTSLTMLSFCRGNPRQKRNRSTHSVRIFLRVCCFAIQFSRNKLCFLLLVASRATKNIISRFLTRVNPYSTFSFGVRLCQLQQAFSRRIRSSSSPTVTASSLRSSQVSKMTPLLYSLLFTSNTAPSQRWPNFL